MVIAKSEQAMKHLSAQFKAKTVKRSYEALVWGNIEQDFGTIDGPIGRHPKNRLQNKVFDLHEADKGKAALTHFEVLVLFGYVTLVSCTLKTERTHQIRVHMAHLKRPLVGDKTYNPRYQKIAGISETLDSALRSYPRQALHAFELAFDHPVLPK